MVFSLNWKQYVRDSLNDSCPNFWIGRCGPTPRPPGSLDITPCDSFVWGFVKDRVSTTGINNKAEMKANIREAFQEIAFKSF